MGRPPRDGGRRESQASAEACGPRAKENARGGYHRFSRTDPALPAQRVDALYVVSLVHRACWPPCPREAKLRRELTPASGCRDATISACASLRSSARTSHAAKLYAHRIQRPTPRDDRETPLRRAGTSENVQLICPTTQGQIVRQTNTTGNWRMAGMCPALSHGHQRSDLHSPASKSSWPGLSRPSTSSGTLGSTWMPGSSPGMTEQLIGTIVRGASPVYCVGHPASAGQDSGS